MALDVLHVWPQYFALNVATWYSVSTASGRQLSPAGWWFAHVPLPLFQFFLARWYVRLFICIRFLWQVARCELRLVPTHPDRVGGLGFLSNTVIAFAPLLAAHGALLAGTIANRIFFQGATLTPSRVSSPSSWAFSCSSCWDRSRCTRLTYRPQQPRDRQGIRVLPITTDAVIQLAVITLLPVAPLLLTMVSLEELLERLLQVLLYPLRCAPG